MSTLSELQRILGSESGISPGAIAPSMRLEQLGIDSLHAIQVIFAIEEAFDVQLDARQYHTIQDLIYAVEAEGGTWPSGRVHSGNEL